MGKRGNKGDIGRLKKAGPITQQCANSRAVRSPAVCTNRLAVK